MEKQGEEFTRDLRVMGIKTMTLFWAGNGSKVFIMPFGIMILVLCIFGMMGEYVFSRHNGGFKEDGRVERDANFSCSNSEICQNQSQCLAVQGEESTSSVVTELLEEYKDLISESKCIPPLGWT